MADNDDLLDYEDEEQTEQVVTETAEAPKKDVKGTYVSIHSSGFRDFLLKPEILRAIVDCGFEHPSEGKRKMFFFFLFFMWVCVWVSFFLFRHFMLLRVFRLCQAHSRMCWWMCHTYYNYYCARMCERLYAAKRMKSSQMKRRTTEITQNLFVKTRRMLFTNLVRFVCFFFSSFFSFLLCTNCVCVCVHYSTARMHSASCVGYGYFVPGQIWYGQNGCIRFGHAATIGANRKSYVCTGNVPYARIGLPDQQRVRTFLQVYASDEGGRLLWRFAHTKGRGDTENDDTAYRRWNTRTHLGIDS